MTHLISVAFFVLSIGILLSISLIGVHQILLLVPTCYFLYQSIKEKKLTLKPSSWFLLSFMAWAVISMCVNYTDLDVPSKSFGKMKYFFFALGGISVLTYWIPQVKKEHIKILFHAFFSSVIIAGSAAIYQFATTGERAESFLGIMKYGYVSAFISTLLLSVILQKKRIGLNFNSKFAIAALVFSLTGLILTQTRGSLGGFVVALPFILYFYKPKLGIAAALFSVLFVGVIGSAYLFGTGKYKHRYLKPQTEKGDVVRQEQWKSAIIATKERPFFGWGYFNFYSQVERIKKENNFKTLSYVGHHSHNTFLEIAAGTGVIGFLLFVGWVLTWAWESFKLPLPLRGIFIPFGACMMLASQFEVVFDTVNSVVILFMYSMSQVAAKYFRSNDYK